MEKENIIKKLNERFSFLREKYHVGRIGIFGSIIRNEQKEESDIDILVEFDAPVGFFEFIRLENYLSEILERKVDLISKKALKPIIKEEILNEVIYV